MFEQRRDDRRLLLTLLKLSFVSTLIAFFIIGCTAPNPTVSNSNDATSELVGVKLRASNFMSPFIEGKVRLEGQNYGNSAHWGAQRHLAETLYNDERWMALARHTVMNAYNADMAYFYLGRAAEGMGHLDAAEVYYRLARETPQKCDYFPALGLNNCDGIVVQSELARAENRLSEKREVEKVQAELERKKERLMSHWVVRDYEINNIEITTESYGPNWLCTSGSINRIEISGVIDRDASFSIGKILGESDPCEHVSGDYIIAPLVIFESKGGLVMDGYKLGNSVRKAGATTAVPEDGLCASACALAFLGGKNRIVGDDAELLFHSPYYNRQMRPGSDEVPIDCKIGTEAKQSLRRYYDEMLGPSMGREIYDRTMSYCSTGSGWVIRGADAAELFDIATQ